MRFRQVHLDFHTSPLIPGIGEKFNKKEWQRALLDAAVDSITLFACCHHGYAYYNTKVGCRHPNLNFDLLRAQVDACREIDVKTPIYLTADSTTMHRLCIRNGGRWSLPGRYTIRFFRISTRCVSILHIWISSATRSARSLSSFRKRMEFSQISFRRDPAAVRTV